MNKQAAFSFQTFLIAALLILFTGISMVAVMPSVDGQGRDSGIFAYTAVVIKDGGLPYVDAWDNKLPLVYYLNALSFILWGENRWALWLLETIIVLLTGLAFFALVRLVLERVWLALAFACFLILLSRHPTLVEAGNFSETYALLFQVTGFWAGYRFLRAPDWRWGFLLGLMSGLAFLSKQNTIGLALMFIPALLLSRHPILRANQRWDWLASMIAGGLLPLFIMGGYLFAHGALDETVDVAFNAPAKFHEWTSQGDHASIPETVVTSLTSDTFNTYLWALAPIFVIGVVLVFFHTWKKLPAPTDYTLEIWAAVTVLVDLTLANFTDRAFPHYYITPLASVTVLMLIVVKSLLMLRWKRYVRYLVQGGIALYMVVMSASLLNAMRQHIWEDDGSRVKAVGESWDDPLTYYVLRHTAPDDYVLVWGASSGINFQSGRRSPTQFHYAYPLIVPDYTTDAMIADLIADLEAHMPLMILDLARRDGDRVPPLGEKDRERWLQYGRHDTKDLSALYAFVEERCEIVDREVDDRVAVYRCE